MSKSMRKILYYENVLEFKTNTKEKLNLSEINNWQLCRTCLVDTSVDDVYMEKMRVMDVIQGTFLNIQEMLVETTNIDITSNEDLPLQLCGECTNKITSLYYFCAQVRKADKVLKRLANKLKGCQDILEEECKTGNNFTETDDIPDESIIPDAEEVYYYSEDFENSEIANETSSTHKICVLKEDFDKTDDNPSSDYVEKKRSDIESIAIKDQESVLLEDEKVTILKNDEEASLESGEDHINFESDEEYEDNHLDKDLFDCLETSDYDNETRIITTTITTEKVQNTTKRPRKKMGNVKPMTGYRHKQPRVTSPLLNDFDCAICQHSFGRQHDLVHHVRELHPNSKAYKCRVCGKLFSHIQSLSRHMNSHKESVILNDCKYCPKSFVRADDLKRHVRIHTGERPHVCSFCQKSYQQHSELKHHEAKHLNLQTRKFECVQCKHTYTSRTGLYLHKRKHHRQTDNENDHLYDCTLCEKSFHLPSELRRHVGCHFRTESIKCIECDEKFTSHNLLYLHKNMHHRTESQAEKKCKNENEVFITMTEEDIQY